MLKNIVIAMLVLSLAGICLFQGWYLSDAVADLQKTTAELQTELDADNWEAAQDVYQKLMRHWDKNFKLLSCFLLHEEVDHAGVELQSIGAQLELRDKQMLSYSIPRLCYYLKHMQDGDSLQIENIL